MSTTRTLDAEAILTATESVLRRHGPEKATVRDVARALGVSHASVYRHFPSKTALREAVTRRWISRAHEGLEPLATDTRLPPPERLRAWLTTLFTCKRDMTSEDPELFATFSILVAEHRAAATDHVADLIGQLRGIITDGVRTGDFTPTDPTAAAHTLFNATMAYHHPAHAPDWHAPETEPALQSVCTLLINGLSAPPGRHDA
ncbi:TetR family transcriptional regulator [Streptomyces sp. B3I8]|uniref:TetR family transcriptional regulator n=1 Tax=Streptomyces sp. B3I8 TaxID=3042303 RepID=UPI002783EC63|nr:TetR family transcriptional regulator [Streptomyces sp. B3I8]MDQ0787183.1 AcrR family transcriptional regulator [Streptomyces sp. B3I8]